MKMIKKLKIYIFGYTYIWESVSLYVLITSMLTCIVHICKNYALDTAAAFIVIIMLSVISILAFGYVTRDAYPYSEAHNFLAFCMDCCVALLGVIVLILEWQLAIGVIIMAVVPQILLGFVEEYRPMEKYSREITWARDIVQIVMVVFITGMLFYEWFGAAIANPVKIIAVVVYLLLVPHITLYKSEIPPIYEVVKPW